MSTIKCSNCGKDIESVKMILHERYCKLNVRKCSICEEPVPIDEYNEHKSIEHPDIKCEFCDKMMSNIEYKSHLKECSKKLFACRYCELYMNKNELKDHEYQCGSKTMTCPYCNQTLTKMDYELHLKFVCNGNSMSNNNNENLINNIINKYESVKTEKEDSMKIFKDNNNKIELIAKCKNNNDIKGNKVSGRKRKRKNDDEPYESKPNKTKQTSTHKKKKK